MKKLLSALAIVLALALAPATAKAGEDYMKWHSEDDGHTLVMEWHDGNDDHVFALKVFVDGQIDFTWWESNPNPDESGKGTAKLDVKDFLALAKQHGGEAKLTPEFWTTPVGQYLVSKGLGLLPKYQPGSDDAGGGHHTTPTTTNINPEKLLQEQAEKAKGAMGKEFEFQPDSGSGKEQVKGMAGKQGKGSGDDKPDKKTSAAHGAFGDLPGPPDIVNPTWGGGKTRTKTKLGALSKDQKIQKVQKVKTTKTAQSSAKCAPNMTPNASGKGCVPKLDMPGMDGSLGSSAGTGRAAPTGGAGPATRGR